MNEFYAITKEAQYYKNNNKILVELSIIYPLLKETNFSKFTINPLASPSAGAPALKYGDVNTETTSLVEVKGLIIINKLILLY